MTNSAGRALYALESVVTPKRGKGTAGRVTTISWSVKHNEWVYGVENGVALQQIRESAIKR